MPRIPAPIVPVVSVVRDAASAWSRHGSERLAASLSFYTLFSLAPILMVVTAIFGAVLGEAEVHTHLSAWLVDTTGPETAATIMELVANADRPGAQAVTAVIGVLTIVLATRTFDHFQGAQHHLGSGPWLGRWRRAVLLAASVVRPQAVDWRLCGAERDRGRVASRTRPSSRAVRLSVRDRRPYTPGYQPCRTHGCLPWCIDSSPHARRAGPTCCSVALRRGFFHARKHGPVHRGNVRRLGHGASGSLVMLLFGCTTPR